jgi:uncharacterized iron-regulated protein
LDGTERGGNIPPLWDGQAARRIVEILRHHPSSIVMSG